MRCVVLIAGIVASSAVAQWDVPARILLDGATDGDKQVLGLWATEETADGVAARVARYQVATYAEATGTDQVSVDLVPPIAAYSAGMQLSFLPQQANTAAATLEVDGLGQVPLVKFGNQPLDSADLRPGIPASVVYDGSAFQLISQAHPACPPGFMAISRDVCVQVAVNDSLGFYPANTWCITRDTRLCSFAEWYRGCNMAGGFGPTLAAFEWVDSAGNDTNHAKRVGSNSGGTFGCDQGGHTVPSTQHLFRCCYDR